ncbi:MAG: hypothetical protein ACTHMV_00615 [Chitinophagaceae bacterium]
MNSSDTPGLRNIDPDDISEVLSKVEKSFGFKFDDTETEGVTTFGKLCDLVSTKVRGEDSNDCTTQQAFYKLRNAIADTLLISHKDLTPDTALQTLLPENTRRRSVKAIDHYLGFRTKVLRPKHAITGLLTMMMVGSLVILFISWQAAISGFIVSILGTSIANRYGNQLDLTTVGQFAEKIAREHYFRSRRAPLTVNRNEIEETLRMLFIADLGLEKSQLTREASFV